MNYTELATQVTERLVSQIETGPDGKWSMPWHRAPHVLDVSNAATGNRYKGSNVFALASASIENGWPTSIFSTFRQWVALGAQVRKGERASQVIRWVTPKNRDESNEAEGERFGGRRLVPVVFSVFNAAQVDGWTPPETPTTDVERDEVADAFITANGAVIDYGHNHAAYQPKADRIELPVLEIRMRHAARQPRGGKGPLRYSASSILTAPDGDAPTSTAGHPSFPGGWPVHHNANPSSSSPQHTPLAPGRAFWAVRFL